MICCVSLNPAVDKYLRLARLRRGEHQQVELAISSAGGKAVNVAGVLRELGREVRLLGLFGGYTGDWVRREATAEGIEVDGVETRSVTRTAFVVVERDGTETEIVEPGDEIHPAEIRRLRMKLRRAARAAEVVVLSGSVPRGCPAGIYLDLLTDCTHRGRLRCPVLLDTSREWLRAVVESKTGPRPTLIKPNRREAEALLGTVLGSGAAMAAALRGFARAGIALPVISDGDAGMMAWNQGTVWQARPPRLRRVNSVGSGDAAVAGFAAGLADGLEVEAMLRLAAACGSANVLTQECARVRRADVSALSPRIRVAACA